MCRQTGQRRPRWRPGSRAIRGDEPLRCRVRAADGRLQLHHDPEDEPEYAMAGRNSQGARGDKHGNEGQQFHRLCYRQDSFQLKPSPGAISEQSRSPASGRARELDMARNIRAMRRVLALVGCTCRGRRWRSRARPDGPVGRWGGRSPLFEPDPLGSQVLRPSGRGGAGRQGLPWTLMTTCGCSIAHPPFQKGNQVPLYMGEVNDGQR